MEGEHARKIQQSFDLLDRALSHDEWEFVTEKRGVAVSHFLFPDDEITTFKGEGVIAVEPKVVLELLIDEKRREEWDMFYENGGLIERISETEGYVYYQTKGQGWTVWPRDFVMAISAKISDSNIEGYQEAKFVGTSVELDSKPAISSHVRGEVNVGGYYLTPVKHGDEIYTNVVYIFNINAAGWIPHSVADMANTYQPLSIIGMRKALTGSSEHTE